MTDTVQVPKIYEIYLKLAQYPILADRIRERMRQEIFQRGVISADKFEQEVKEKAILSQQREGLVDPYGEESAEVWERRKKLVRDYLTDFYFGYNLPGRLLDDIIREELRLQHADQRLALDFNPELAPWDLLFTKGHQFEALPAEERSKVQHHLREIKVVLIKAMISDQLRFVGIAREYFSIADLDQIRRRRIGRGKIGGKAAGMTLAWTILHRAQGVERLIPRLAIPESYYLGADVFYEFLELNNLLEHLNQKYKTPEQIVEDWRHLPQRFAQGRFPEYIVDELRGILARLGNAPFIVRSSSLLEDNVGTSFAGKYESVFCPNQGTPKENLRALLQAISRVYASSLNPDALLYRRRVGLIDYDERMAVIIQRLVGSEHRGRFFPALAGVAFSRNPFLWTPRLKREEGFARIVVGLGTRAVDRVPDDYPRMVSLSHPTLRPERDAAKIRHYSQHHMDVIDLAANRWTTLPVSEVIDQSYPWLRLMASRYRDDMIEPLFSTAATVAPQELVITLDGFLTRTDFVPLMKQMLQTLETAYGTPVDVEFAVELRGSPRQPEVVIHLLQCRPQSDTQDGRPIVLPTQVPAEDVLFATDYLVPNGIVERIRYVVYVDPWRYAQLPAGPVKREVGRVVGRLNRRLEGERFILMGPGRWGSTNEELGVKVGYADIFNTRVLVELGIGRGGGMPEVSHGTHFFQDLVEARIFPLAVFPQQPEARFNRRFLEEAPNCLTSLLPEAEIGPLASVIRVIDVPAVRDGQLLEVVMSLEQGKALAYFRHYPPSGA
ncbi:MAG: PEP/pyruvate-binding domain-containing protein [Caldilineales bacterium]|nr:PEP/pyruvate-binding domain-containing protein [Caldilineales bacterium]